MLNVLALPIVALASLYFVALSVVSFTSPSRASSFLMGFASSAATHYAELLVRAIVGLAFIVQAAHVPFPPSFRIFGWLLVGTTAILFLIPWQWHRKFTQRAVPQALRYLRAVAVVSLFMGGFVLWSIIRGGPFIR